MDKKLKNAGEKIIMPEDMKERIIKACEPLEANSRINDNDDDYTDVVSGTERVSGKSSIIRTISAIAACAVVVAGIGATGAFLNKHKIDQLSDTDSTEITTVIDTEQMQYLPFGDFRKLDCGIGAGCADYGPLNGKIYEDITDYLNSVNWGEEVEEQPDRISEIDAFEYPYYIMWDKGPNTCDILIADDGYVVYMERKYSDDSTTYEIFEKRFYQIDFEAFDKGFRALRDKGDPITQDEMDELFRGEMISAQLYDMDRTKYDQDDEDINSRVEEFIRNDFVTMLRSNVPLEEDDKEIWYVEYLFREDDKTEHLETYSIHLNHLVIRNGYDIDAETGLKTLTDTKNYYIDLEEFERRINECASQQDDQPTTPEDTDEDGSNDMDALRKSVEKEVRQYLEAFPDVELVVGIRDKDYNDVDIPDEESREKLQSFIENKFKYSEMLKCDHDGNDDAGTMGGLAFGVDLRYMSDGREVLGRYYNIMDTGWVLLSDCKYDPNGNQTWSGPFNYWLDINEFYAGMEECGLR